MGFGSADGGGAAVFARIRSAVRYVAVLASAAGVASLAALPMGFADVAAQSGGPLGAAMTAYPGGKWTPGPKRYGTLAVENVPVTADDGTVLNAVVFYPKDLTTQAKARGKFPVIVEHTIYQARAANPKVRFLTEQGYIYTVVSARGAWKSGGKLEAFTSRDAQDGRAIIDWAAYRLDGSDGRLAIIGCSWPAVMALGDAAFAGPNSPVKAVIAACAGLDAVQHQSWLIGGATNASFWTLTGFAAGAAGNTAAAKTFFADTNKEIIAGGPAAYDGSFWSDRSPIAWARKIADNDIPVLFWGGWRDISETSVMRTYTALQNASHNRPLEAPMVAGQQTTPKYQIILGDWPHGGGLESGVYLEWLETWVKGVDTGIQTTPTTMHLFEKGTSRWVNAPGYPIVQRATKWALAAGGDMKDGAFAPAGSDTIRFGDPAAAAGKLTFRTPPLVAGTTIAGPMSATLYARTSNTNLMLITRLYDVSPDGTKDLVSSGVVVGSQRELDLPASWKDASGTYVWPWPKLDRDKYLTPGKVYEFDIPMLPRQWGIRPGHRLQFEITTQTPLDICPAYPALPARGSPEPCGLTDPQRRTIPGGEYQILYGPKTPSALNLPQLAAGAMTEVRSGKMPVTDLEPEPGRPAEEIVLPLDWGNPK